MVLLAAYIHIPSHPPCIDCPFLRRVEAEKENGAGVQGSSLEAGFCCCVMSGVRTEEKRQHFCFRHVRGSNQGPLGLCTRLNQVDQDAIFLAHNLTDHKRMVSTMVCGPFGGIYPYPFSEPEVHRESNGVLYGSHVSGSPHCHICGNHMIAPNKDKHHDYDKYGSHASESTVSGSHCQVP